MRFLPAFLLLPVMAVAQLIPAGQPVPKTTNPPVVFLDGYQTGCVSSDFASNFQLADRVLQTAGLVTLYFDNCSIPGFPSIETLGTAFGTFLSKLVYTDGTPVTQVDVIAHSMGGLIVRSYLAGKQDGAAVFNPPANPGIRKVIFLGTPHFGSTLASTFGGDKQTTEMSPGSKFLFDLATWNQGSDDLQGVQAMAIIGTGGTGGTSGITGFDDGVVYADSAALGFVKPGLTRVLPYCQTANSLTAFVCSPGVAALNKISDPTSVESQIILSFLAGTNTWQSLGDTPEANLVINTRAGALVAARDASDNALSVTSANTVANGATTNLSVNSGTVAFGEKLGSAAKVTFNVTPATGSAQSATAALPGGTESAYVVKPGPSILRVIPAASGVFPLSVAPGAYAAIYGSGFTASTVQSPPPYPTQLADVQVLVNGTAAQLVFVSPTQINFLYPAVATGITKLSVKSSLGQNTVNVMLAAAVPSIFSQDASGTGAALAVNALTGILDTATTPLRAGDFVSIYMTGLGATSHHSDGLDWAQTQPTVTIGGQPCNVLFAGRNPVYPGLDQVNCQVPAGLGSGAVPLVITSGTRASNAVSLTLQ